MRRTFKKQPRLIVSTTQKHLTALFATSGYSPSPETKAVFFDVDILHSPDHRIKKVPLTVWYNPLQVWGNHCLHDPIIRE